MGRKLVFIHGRTQRGKEPAALKKEWLQSLDDGLHAHGLTRSIDDADVLFPWYGEALEALVQWGPSQDAAEAVLHAATESPPERVFMSAVMEQSRKEAGVTKAELKAIAGNDVFQRGPLDRGWLQGLVRALDRHVPLANGTGVALATYDAYQYLYTPAFARTIDAVVMEALVPGEETVVVAHSLGALVAYNLFRAHGAARGWKVPLFVTLGAPLAVTAIRDSLGVRAIPSCVEHWFNAKDERDVVALYPLDQRNFQVDDGTIENWSEVRNPTENRHGASGYLGDPEVARRIHEALG
ncbi:hypothetical protein BWI17_02035 [Betaproteobacteria bacterium GR16-43]|nr:hypothetical protein BWI17_02035 [Betaproteobacteria bacterium GR16-43]